MKADLLASILGLHINAAYLLILPVHRPWPNQERKRNNVFAADGKGIHLLNRTPVMATGDIRVWKAGSYSSSCCRLCHRNGTNASNGPRIKTPILSNIISNGGP